LAGVTLLVAAMLSPLFWLMRPAEVSAAEVLDRAAAANAVAPGNQSLSYHLVATRTDSPPSGQTGTTDIEDDSEPGPRDIGQTAKSNLGAGDEAHAIARQGCPVLHDAGALQLAHPEDIRRYVHVGRFAREDGLSKQARWSKPRELHALSTGDTKLSASGGPRRANAPGIPTRAAPDPA
jgi:hypothetical protein